MNGKMACLLLAWGIGLGTASAYAADTHFELRSPDGKITLNVTASDRLEYSVTLPGETVINPSRLGLEFKGAPPLAGNFAVTGRTMRTIDQTWENPLGKTRQVRDHANELTLALEEKTVPKRKMEVIFRVYDDGVAFRYVLPKQEALGGFVLTKDASEFAFEGNPTVWAANYEGFHASQESEFVKQPLADLKKRKTPYGLPLLVKVSPQAYVAITEADLTDWSGMWLAPGEKPGSLTASLAPRLDKDGLVKSAAPRQSPWRVLLIGTRAGALLESNTIQNLNPPCAIADPSWIKPGLMAWDHWWSGDTKMDMPTQKAYIQLAADMGWPYQLVDWWWYGEPDKPTSDVTKMAPQMDIPALVAFAKERNVRLWLWFRYNDLDRKLDEALDMCAKWGIAGVKIDFMDSDDQDMVNWYAKVVKKAAERKLMVNFHGAFKPTGMNRTWPNQITREGVMGNEYNKWSKRVTPTHTVTLPFTRFLAGPADFTPGGFLNRSVEKFQTNVKPAQVMGTRAHQLAMFVVYDSPICCVCDAPENIRGKAGSEFLRVVPTVWDETKVLSGEPGEQIVVARRSGQDWYLGAMTNEQARTIEVPLTFLGAGTFEAQLYADGAESATDAEKVEEAKKTLTAKDKLTIVMAPGGGLAARLVKKK